MATEGRLEEVALADICQLLGMGRKTGCLTVTDRSNFGYIFFDQGRVIYATILNRPDRLGELLVRNEVIDRSELSAAMEEQAHRPGRRLGQVLVERGSLSEEALTRFITVQIEEAVYHLLAWEEGAFRFDPGLKPSEEHSLTVSLHPENLLLEGARRVDEWSQIQRRITSLDLVFVADRVPGEGEGIELTDHQRRILALLNGERTVDDLVRDSGLGHFDASKALYGLAQAGLVRKEGRRSLGDDRGGEGDCGRQCLALGDAFYRAGMLEDAEKEYIELLEVEPESQVARSRLALIALRSKRPEVALEHFDALSPPERLRASNLRNRAFALEELGRYDEAIEVLDEAARIHPDNDLLLFRAVVHFKARRSRSALELFERYRHGLEPGSFPPEIFFAYALLAQAATGESEEALRLGREGLSAHPASGAILVNMGVVLEHRGEFDAAEVLYLRAVALEDASPAPQAYKNLGDLAHGRGDRDGALQLWRRALELNPANDVVRRNLERLAAARGG